MSSLEAVFWLSAACVAYSYVVYPLILAVVARAAGRPPRLGRFDGSVSIVVTALNEAETIGRRLDELTALVAASGREAEILVVSDGSTDETVAIAGRYRDRGVRVVELAEHVGKSAALNAGCARARNDVLVFADARQSWAPDALERLLENFADPEVGAAGGQLRIESRPGVMAGVGLYWRLETWMRRRESRWASVVGLSGAFAAVRRELFRPIPAGTILDDVYWPMAVVMGGSRVVYDARAIGFDRFPEQIGDEFRRKVRTLCGNFQLLAALPSSLSPWRNPVWFQLVSHKVSRLVVPWALLAMLVAGAALASPLYRFLFWGQVAFYLIALAGLRGKLGSRSRLVSAAASLVTLNAAAWLAFWVWAAGRSDRAWGKVTYALATD
jgi:cellulose synthase/poly-beta-1,6-N-acetylglucosamine synthase-like glycosyltransferase